MFLVNEAVAFVEQDYDHIFSYNTKQQVLIRHCVLGMIENSLRGVIAVFVLVYVLYVNGGYLDIESSKGNIVTHVSGTAVAQSLLGKPISRFFAAEDIAFPNLEPGHVFITTKMDELTQRRGVCEDQEKPCATNDDCSTDAGGKCSPNGFCVEPSWCMDEQADVLSFKPVTADMKIWVKSSIEFFPTVEGSYFFANEMGRPVVYPNPGFNTLTVRDLLLLCEPPLRYEEIAELGAAMEVQFLWACSTEFNQCRPHIRAKRLDSIFDAENIGFEFSRSVSAGQDKRVKEVRRGIRLYFRTVGVGTRMSFARLVFMVSTAGAMLSIAPIITDLIMLRMMRKHKSYHARKFIVTPDFDAVDEIEDAVVEEEDDGELIHAQREEEWQKRMNDEA